MNETILVVEDQPELQAMVAMALTEEGYLVDAVGDGDEALEQIRQRRPHLLILDLLMPKRDGFSVLRELREDQVVPGLPVIVITAIAGLTEQNYALSLGAVALLTKPFLIKDLLQTTRRILAEAEWIS